MEAMTWVSVVCAVVNVGFCGWYSGRDLWKKWNGNFEE